MLRPAFMNVSSRIHRFMLFLFIVGMLSSMVMTQFPTPVSASQTFSCDDGGGGINGYTDDSQCAQYVQTYSCTHSDSPYGPIDTLTCDDNVPTPMPPTATPIPPTATSVPPTAPPVVPTSPLPMPTPPPEPSPPVLPTEGPVPTFVIPTPALPEPPVLPTLEPYPPLTPKPTKVLEPTPTLDPISDPKELCRRFTSTARWGNVTVDDLLKKGLLGNIPNIDDHLEKVPLFNNLSLVDPIAFFQRKGSWCWKDGEITALSNVVTLEHSTTTEFGAFFTTGEPNPRWFVSDEPLSKSYYNHSSIKIFLDPGSEISVAIPGTDIGTKISSDTNNEIAKLFLTTVLNPDGTADCSQSGSSKTTNEKLSCSIDLGPIIESVR